MQKYLLSFLFMFIISACNKDEQAFESHLELSHKELIFLDTESTQSIEIKSNDPWVIIEKPDWITPSQMNGTGYGTLLLKVDANPKEEDRTASLKISSNDKVRELNIRQIAKNVILYLSQAELFFSAEPEKDGFTIDLVTNENWTVKDLPEWCQLSNLNGNGSESITVTVNKNYSDVERSANFKVHAGSKSVDVSVIQQALDISLHFTYKESQTATYYSEIVSSYNEGGVYEIMVSSNTKWKINKGSESWYTLDKMEGIEKELITLTVLPNTGNSDRRSKFRIEAGNQYLTINIQQSKYIEPTNSPYQISVQNNAPRIGDYLVKKQIEFIDPGNGGENVHWIFNSFVVINDKYEVYYSAPSLDREGDFYYMGQDKYEIKQFPANSIWECYENNAIYNFQLKNNNLEALGHENPSFRAIYNPTMLSSVYSAKFNNPIRQQYKGSLIYSSVTPFEWWGYTEITTDGYGTITLPCGTYSDAIRIKSVQMITDSLDNNNEYVIYRWYIKGCRYPVLEVHRRSVVGSNSEVSSTGFYFSPKDQAKIKRTDKVFK